MQNHLPPQLPPQPVALAPAPSGSISQFKETDDLQLENGPGDGTILVDIDETGWRALRPRPSLDPNDPLNWPREQKYMTYLTICFYTFLATVNASKYTVCVRILATDFHVSPTVAGYQVCFNVMMMGVGNIFWVPLMRVIGKRPVFLLAIPLQMACNVWASRTHSWNSLLAASIVSGFASAAGEGAVPAVVADLFFVSERGTMMMIFHIALSAGFFLGPLINAFVVQYASWRVANEWLAIAAGVTWVVGLFTIHETSYYKRDVNASEASYPPRRGLLRNMGVTLGFNREQSLWKALWNTIAVVAYPPVLWSGLTVGTFVGWNIVVQVTSTQTFLAPPYSWRLHSVGLLSISGFLGAVLASFFGGKLIDLISNSITVARQGRREPETRLWGIVIPAIIGPMGILIFGLTLAARTTWVGPACGYAMQGFGLTAVSNVVVTYAVDSYLPLAGEALVVVFVIRGITGTVLALYSVDWIQGAGEREAFGEMVGIQYFVVLSGLVGFLLWGKAMRKVTARYGPMVWEGHGGPK